MVVYDFHVQTSKPRRLTTASHTGVYSVVDVSESPPQLMVRLTQKLDFGPLMVHGGGKNSFVDPKEQEQHRQAFDGKMLRKRVVNQPGTNGYEKWLSAFICTDDNNDKKMLGVKFSNPSTILANASAAIPASERQAEPMITKRGGKKYQQKGIESKF